jgi:hypothetical protein
MVRPSVRRQMAREAVEKTAMSTRQACCWSCQ